MNLITQILNDLRVELADEFDRNFERKAFFGKSWPARRSSGKGTLMNVTGTLRRSIRARVSGTSLVFSSSEPHAAIHNDGGTISVTAKMRRFFWAKYYETAGRVRYKKSGGVSKRSIRLSQEAGMWHALALKKVGSKITIPQRQFLGDAPEVRKIINDVAADRVKMTIETVFKNQLNKH